MPIVGFNFDKISGERKNPLKKGMSVNSDIKLESVEEAILSLKKPCLKINFKFIVNYTPDIGTLELKGHILYLEDEAKVKEIAKGWKDNKNLPQEVSLEVLNSILNKCNIESLSLSSKINLPPQIPMSKIAPKKQPSVAQ